MSASRKCQLGTTQALINELKQHQALYQAQAQNHTLNGGKKIPEAHSNGSYPYPEARINELKKEEDARRQQRIEKFKLALDLSSINGQKKATMKKYLTVDIVAFVSKMKEALSVSANAMIGNNDAVLLEFEKLNKLINECVLSIQMATLFDQLDNQNNDLSSVLVLMNGINHACLAGSVETPLSRMTSILSCVEAVAEQPTTSAVFKIKLQNILNQYQPQQPQPSRPGACY